MTGQAVARVNGAMADVSVAAGGKGSKAGLDSHATGDDVPAEVTALGTRVRAFPSVNDGEGTGGLSMSQASASVADPDAPGVLMHLAFCNEAGSISMAELRQGQFKMTLRNQCHAR